MPLITAEIHVVQAKDHTWCFTSNKDKRREYCDITINCLPGKNKSVLMNLGRIMRLHQVAQTHG